MTMGHRVAVMKDGVLQQCAPPNVVYNEPANAFVASFIGSPSMNMLPARVESSGPEGGLSVVAGCIRRRLTPSEVVSLHGENDVVLGLRAEHVEPRLVSTDAHVGDDHRFTGRVRVVEPLGSDQFVTIDLDGVGTGANRLTARLSPDQPVRVGDHIAMRSTLAGAHLFAPTTGRRVLTFEAPQDDR
jgi:ABC-type sugar transport system ATPase subunit